MATRNTFHMWLQRSRKKCLVLRVSPSTFDNTKLYQMPGNFWCGKLYSIKQQRTINHKYPQHCGTDKIKHVGSKFYGQRNSLSLRKHHRICDASFGFRHSRKLDDELPKDTDDDALANVCDSFVKAAGAARSLASMATLEGCTVACVPKNKLISLHNGLV